MIRIDAAWLAVNPIDMRTGVDRLLASVVHVFRRRTGSSDLVGFMELVALAYPTGSGAHRVGQLEHSPGAVRVGGIHARHNHRFVFHFTPIHPSWVNQIEPLFGIYACRGLRHARHSSMLRQRTDAFMAQRNQAPQPFKWTFAGFELQTGEPLRFKHHAHASRSRKGR